MTAPNIVREGSRVAELRQKMARYFFHLRCSGNDVIDPLGADLRDPDQAWEAARATARDLMEAQADANVNWLRCYFDVVDEAGEIVFELPFSEVVEIRPKPNWTLTFGRGGQRSATGVVEGARSQKC